MKIILILLILLSGCGKNGVAHCVRNDEYFYTNVDFKYHNQYVLSEEETIVIKELELSEEEIVLINKHYQINYLNDEYVLKRYLDYQNYDLSKLNSTNKIDNYFKHGQLNIFKTIENYQKAGFVCKY